jgi:hypothetical protein
MCGSAAYVMYLHALMVGCAGNVHREGDEAADEGHEVVPQILGRLRRLVADQLLRGKIEDHLKQGD